MERTRASAGISLQERRPQPAGPPQPELEKTPPARYARRSWTMLLAIALLIAGIAGVVAYQRWQIGKALPEGLIQVNGRIEGDRVTIASKFAGRIGRLLVREGDTVTRGQVVAQIDDSQTRHQLDQARANLQMATAQAQGADTNVSLTSATTSAQIVQAEGLVHEAESGISGAQADLERARAAVPNAAAMVRTAEANVATARAALEAARAEKSKAEAGLASAQAQVTRAQADLRAAQAATEAALAASDRAEHDARRIAQLFAENAVSAQAEDQATLTAQAARAQLETARQQAIVAEAGITARQAEVNSARHQVAAAQAAIAQAKAQVVAASEQVAAARAGKRQAEAQALSALQMISQAQGKRLQALGSLNTARTAPQQIDISRTGHAQATARIAQAKAAVQELQSVLYDMSLVSPISGTVTTRLRDTGEVLSAGTPVLDLVDLDTLYLKAYVPEAQVGKLRLGLPARIYVDAFPNTYFEATVGYIASTAEFTPKEVQTPDERVKLVYAIKLYVKNNAARRLTPGMVADAIIRWKEGETWERPRW